MKKIKTFEDALKKLGITFQAPEGATVDEIAYMKLKISAKALNGNWTPDWNNSNEYKYYPWFRMRGSFSCDGYSCDSAGTDVGSRLCYKSSELAEYAGKQFEDLYKEYMK